MLHDIHLVLLEEAPADSRRNFFRDTVGIDFDSCLCLPIRGLVVAHLKVLRLYALAKPGWKFEVSVEEKVDWLAVHDIGSACVQHLQSWIGYHLRLFLRVPRFERRVVGILLLHVVGHTPESTQKPTSRRLFK